MLSARIARAGYGEAVIEMALRRKGYEGSTRLMALVVRAPRCHCAGRAAAKPAQVNVAVAGTQRHRCATRKSRDLSWQARNLFCSSSPASALACFWLEHRLFLGFEDGFDSFARSSTVSREPILICAATLT